MMLKRGVEVPWSVEESNRLERLRASGVSWTNCARLLGRSKSSCKGRIRRVKAWAAAGVDHESATADRALRAEAALQDAKWECDPVLELAVARPWK